MHVDLPIKFHSIKSWVGKEFRVECTKVYSVLVWFDFYFSAELKPQKDVKKVVEGTSEYQSAWIVDSEGSEISDEESSEEEAELESTMSDEESVVDEDMTDLVYFGV